MRGSYKVSTLNEDVPSSSHVNHKGMHWLMATVFIIANLAGGGMIAMPNAIMNLGTILGLVLLILTAIITYITGLQLSYSWHMMQNRWDKYRNVCRKPYSEIAYRACGSKMRIFVGILICVTSFGFATVLLLLASKNIMILLYFFFNWKINECYLILIMGIAIYPFSMLRSPRHFWQIAVFAAGSSSLAAILLLIGAAHDAPVCSQDVPHRGYNFHEACMAYGTLLFAYGGHCIFPTIQMDMKKPVHFAKSVIVGFTVVTIYYISVSLTSVLVYGSSIGDIIIPSIQLSWVQHIVNVMIAIHVVTTIIIVFSPLAQQVEDLFKIPHKFGWQRFVIRTFLFWTIVFIGLTLPHFGPMMDLIGSSTMALTSIILPPLFYLFIRASCEKAKDQGMKPHLSEIDANKEWATLSDVIHYTPKSMLIINIFIMACGIVGGLVAMIASIIRLADTTMGVPCYVQYFRGGLEFHSNGLGIVNCCGSYHNVTVSGRDPTGYCSAYRPH